MLLRLAIQVVIISGDQDPILPFASERGKRLSILRLVRRPKKYHFRGGSTENSRQYLLRLLFSWLVQDGGHEEN